MAQIDSMDPIAWTLFTHHTPLCESSCIPVPLGEGAALEGAGYLAELSMNGHTPIVFFFV